MRPLYVSTLVLLVAACEPGVLPWIPPNFPEMPVPENNPLTRASVELGKRLFFDEQLSRTGEVSCASCHQQQHAFADPRPLSVGIIGREGVRNSPPLFNLAWNTSFFWDGGAPTLEHQVIGPLTNPVEMDMTMTEAVRRLSEDAQYVPMFEAAFGAGPNPEAITKSIASFMRTLVSGDSAYDRFVSGDASALEDSERRGMELFFSEKAECFHCHLGFNLTNNGFHNNGTRPDDPDLGREAVTERESDRGRFKVPSLRNVAVTAPYMHDGSLRTLREVVDHYDRGGQGHANTDPTIHPLHLTEAEKSDLVSFLNSLTDDSFLTDPRHAPR